MIVLIDNYDSFSYNLYQLIGEIQPEIRVLRNDEMTVEELRSLEPEKIILSPGPGRPERCGNYRGSGPHFGPRDSAAGGVFGASGHLRRLWRSHHLCQGADARQGLRRQAGFELPPVPRGAGRSPRWPGIIPWRPSRTPFPIVCKVTAATEDGEVMAVQHREYPIFGVQFHPESILTPEGKTMLRNFIEM